MKKIAGEHLTSLKDLVKKKKVELILKMLTNIEFLVCLR